MRTHFTPILTRPCESMCVSDLSFWGRFFVLLNSVLGAVSLIQKPAGAPSFSKNGGIQNLESDAPERPGQRAPPASHSPDATFLAWHFTASD